MNMSVVLKALGVFTLMLSANIASAACTGLYNHQFKTLNGKELNLCEYQNHVILVVNTASKCGFTPQFEALEKLYSTNKDKNLLVVGFPSNDFRQEHKTDKEVGDFCKMTYGVEFPMMTKTVVTGENANPFYKELIAKTNQAPKWNFYKYIITPNAKEVYAFTSMDTPNDPAIMSKITPYLKK